MRRRPAPLPHSPQPLPRRGPLSAAATPAADDGEAITMPFGDLTVSEGKMVALDRGRRRRG